MDFLLGLLVGALVSLSAVFTLQRVHSVRTKRLARVRVGLDEVLDIHDAGYVTVGWIERELMKRFPEHRDVELIHEAIDEAKIDGRLVPSEPARPERNLIFLAHRHPPQQLA